VQTTLPGVLDDQEFTAGFESWGRMGDGILKRGLLWLAAHRVGVATTFALLGLADIVTRWWLLPGNSGLLAAANDPGKDFFHVVLLPMSVFFILSFPPQSILNLEKTASRIALTMLITIQALCVLWTFDETGRSFFGRLASPEDIRDPAARIRVYELREQLRSKVALKTINPDVALKQARLAAATEIGSPPSLKRYLQNASLRRHVATTLTWIGVSVVAFLFWMILTIPITGFIQRRRTRRDSKPISEKEKKYFLSGIAMLALWLPLKLYTEWHGSFYAEKVDDPTIFIGGLLVVMSVLVVFFCAQNRLVGAIPSAAIAGISSLAALVLQAQGGWFTPVASKISELGAIPLLFLYVILVLGAAAMAMHAYAAAEQEFNR